MNKDQMVEKLQRYSYKNQSRAEAQRTLARYFAWYFKNIDIAQDRRHGWWSIESRLPQLLFCALVDLYEAPDEILKAFREDYELAAGHGMPHLTSGYTNHNEYLIRDVKNVFLDILTSAAGHKFCIEFDQLMGAQKQLLNQVAYEFITRVYRRGLYELISSRGPRYQARSGGTILRTFTTGVGLVFSFSTDEESRTTFVCEEDDPLGLGIRLHSMTTDTLSAVAMVSAFIAAWPGDKADQEEISVTITEMWWMD